RWFAPDVDELAAAMRAIAGDPEAARHRAAPARDDLIRRFGPEAVAAIIREGADEVADRYARLTASGRAVYLRGRFGRNESLAHVNDRLLTGLETRGRHVLARPPKSALEPVGAPTLSHSWPPEFDPATAGP